MEEELRQRTIVDIMDEVLTTVGEYYDADYVYYIEKEIEDDSVSTVYEWCAPDMPSQREYLKVMTEEDTPDWFKRETQDSTEASYSAFRQISEGMVSVLAAVEVHHGGSDPALLHAVMPYIAQSIVNQKQQKQQEYLSYHDDLTGLLNRNSFVLYLEEVQKKKLKSLGILSVDINSLKLFNQEFGREYGDEVVIRVGEILEEYFKGAMVYRLTGDEYMVIIENIPYEKFNKQIHGANTKLENISRSLVAMGHAWEKMDIDANRLVEKAVEAMHDEKAEHRKHPEKFKHVPIIKEDLLEDIKQQRFIVCLQPIMDVERDSVARAEALVRYRHKDIGIIGPERYLRLLEQTKLSHYLDLYMFQEICKILHRWIQNDMDLIPISVNMSCTTLRQEGIVDKMIAIINQYHVPCEYLELEIAEEGGSVNPEMIAEISNQIRKSNIRVSLDNFGTRNTSMSILSVMEFDVLKLDQTLITNIVGNSRSQVVTQSIIELCHKLGVHVIANGVETKDQLNMLKELNCDYAQGFMFNKAIAVDAFEVRYMQK
ncbi:MAG: GGDEF domain-containing protein [Hespellia sp.]|nr:GGDEF domain-containing protein [Hespellia sp.]